MLPDQAAVIREGFIGPALAAFRFRQPEERGGEQQALRVAQADGFPIRGGRRVEVLLRLFRQQTALEGFTERIGSAGDEQQGQPAGEKERRFHGSDHGMASVLNEKRKLSENCEIGRRKLKVQKRRAYFDPVLNWWVEPLIPFRV